MQIDKIKTIINADLITMRGSKKSNLLLAAVTGCICIFGAFLVSPLVGSYLPLVTGLLIVPLLFQNEQRYHCDKLYCLLPVTRRDVVNARYLFTAALNLVTCLSNFAVTLVSYKFKVYLKVIGDDNDILDKLTATLSSSLSKTGVIVVTCFAMNALSFIMCSSILRNYFKNPESIGVNVSLSKQRHQPTPFSGKAGAFVFRRYFATRPSPSAHTGGFLYFCEAKMQTSPRRVTR